MVEKGLRKWVLSDSAKEPEIDGHDFERDRVPSPPTGRRQSWTKEAGPLIDEARSQAHRRGMKPWLRVGSASFQVAYFVIGISAIIFWTYLFGHPILESNLAGSDSGFHLSMITWIDRWFPRLPSWYPLQGVGTSAILQYPYGAHYLVVLLSRASGLTITQAFRVTQFASVALTACGVYLLVWRKMQNQTMALIAGLLYPLSSAAWRWVLAIGLFSQSVSLIFFAPTFLLFDAYLLMSSGQQSSVTVRRRRLLLLAASTAFCLMMVTHITTAFVFAMTILLYVLVSTVSQRNGRNLSTLIRHLGISFVALIPGIVLAAFWLVPFLYLSSLANRQGAIGQFALDQIPYLDLLSLIGLRGPPEASPMWAVILASPVVILAAVGLVLSLARSKTVLSLAIVSIAFAIFTAMPGIWLELVNVFKPLWANVYVRALIPTMIFLPAIAAYGAVELPRLIFNIPNYLIGRFKRSQHLPDQRMTPRSILKSGFATLLGVALAAGSFVVLRHVPPGYGEYQGYGPTLRAEYWPFKFDNLKISINQWPQFTMSTEDRPITAQIANELAEVLSLDEGNRLEMSPSLGWLVEWLPLFTDSSQIDIYYYVASLNRPMWGYQSATYWQEDYGSPHEVDEFARWLGIEYLILEEERNWVENFEDGIWQPIPLTGDNRFSNIDVRRFSESTGLASVFTKPDILVIGGYENGSYEKIFRLFNSGVIPYQEGTIVEGSHWIDDYSLEALSQFELVLLYGYDYKNSDHAWDLLAEYVRGGGALYIETGWQYWTPDWQIDPAPPIFPVENLEWKLVMPSDELSLASDANWANIDVQQFAPMIWEDQPWGVSTPSRGLRNWASPVLEASGKPIVAVGDYGAGKVVWSGMNQVGHIRTYDNNKEEVAFFKSLLQWLLPTTGSSQVVQPEIIRDYPDRISLTIPGPVDQGTSLLWREAYAPGWAATVEIEGRIETLPTYRAGPGLVLVPLPVSQEDEMIVTLNYSLAGVRGVGLGATALSGALLVGFAVWKPRNWKVKGERVPESGAMNQNLRDEGTDIATAEIPTRRNRSHDVSRNEIFATESEFPLADALGHPEDE